MAKPSDTPADRLPPERPSIVDVFENFLGVDMQRLAARDIEKLDPEQALELVDQIEIFLKNVPTEEFAEDAIALDGFASPIIIPYDRTEPRTTRRAKQVSLAHSEVIIPVEEFSLNYANHGRDHLISFALWTQKNQKLLRPHIFTLTTVPELLDLLSVDDVSDLGDYLIELLQGGAYESFLQRWLPHGQALDKEKLESRLSEICYASLQDAAAAAVFGTGIAFTQEKGGRLYQICADALASLVDKDPSFFSHAKLLHDLELPAIDDLADEEFVSIRLSSEDFDQFRGVLNRSLRKTTKQVEAGIELNEAFRENLDEVRWQAELLRRDTKDKHLMKYLRSTVQNVSIGSIVSTAATAAATPPQSMADLQSLAARFGASAVLGTLFALLLYKTPKHRTQLLRFYDMLLDDRPYNTSTNLPAAGRQP